MTKADEIEKALAALRESKAALDAADDEVSALSVTFEFEGASMSMLLSFSKSSKAWRLHAEAEVGSPTREANTLLQNASREVRFAGVQHLPLLPLTADEQVRARVDERRRVIANTEMIVEVMRKFGRSR